MFASHHWPRWGGENVHEFLILQRDLYRWMHDQTMRLANHGYVPTEIAEMLKLLEELLAQSHTRGYYGDLVHNVKAVYQRYLSWYDGNPAHLHRLPPTELGARYVELAGGPDALVDRAQISFDAGGYRWVVELLNHLVFANPKHVQARHLQADAFEQLGYQAESSTFCNAYLMGAQELRNGPPPPANGIVRGRGLIIAMTIQQIFDTLAVRLKSDEMGGISLAINWTFTDLNEKWILGVSNRTLYSTFGRHEPTAAVGIITLTGDPTPLMSVFGNLDNFQTNFSIVEECWLDDELRERLLNTQLECTFMWTNKAGQPFGVAMSYLWRNGSIWLTAANTRPRVAAVRRTGYAAVMISSVGTDIGPGKTVSLRGPCIVHDDRATRDWMLPALAKSVRPDNAAGEAAFLEHLDSPGRIVLELKPEYKLDFDSKKMWSARPEAAPP